MKSFREHVILTFDRLKCKNRGDPLVLFPIRDSELQLIAFLKPITQEYRLSDPHLPQLLTRWRIENPTLSTGKFEATAERTAKWLDHLVIGREDRLIFMIVSPTGVPLGHLGYSNFNFEMETGEIDSVLKGVKQSCSGLMTFATLTLLSWGFQELKMREITLSVYSDNESAVRFYEKLGFVKTQIRPLFKVTLPDEEKLEVAPDGYTGPIEKYYLYMKYEGKRGHHATV